MQAKSGRAASISTRHPERMDAKVPVNQKGPRGTSPKCAASSLRPGFFVMAEAASRRKVRSLVSRESISPREPLHREYSSASQPGPPWHAAKLVLTALCSRLLSLRICSVRRGSPGDAPTVGDCGRRGRAGQEALPEPSRIGGEIPVHPCEEGIKGGPMARQHGTRQPAPGRPDRTIRSPASYPTRAMERQSSEVWCQPAGAWKSRGRTLLSGLGPSPPGHNMPPMRVLVARARCEPSKGPRR